MTVTVTALLVFRPSEAAAESDDFCDAVNDARELAGTVERKGVLDRVSDGTRGKGPE